MRTVILFLAALLSGQILFGQTTNVYQEEIIETFPEYPGGIQEFYKYVTSNLNLSTKKNKKLGGKKIYIQFVIDQEGNVKENSVSSVSGMTTVEDDELIENVTDILKNSPRWKPGTSNGEPIEMRQIMPLKF